MASTGYTSGSESASRTSSTRIAWELVRNASFEPFLKPTNSETQVGTQLSVLQQASLPLAHWFSTLAVQQNRLGGLEKKNQNNLAV